MEGNIINRESFLDHIAQKLNRPRGNETKKPDWNYKPQLNVLKNANQDELTAVLKKQCEVIHTDYIEAAANEVADTIDHILKSNQLQSVITYDDPRFNEYGLGESARRNWEENGINSYIWDNEKKEENIKAAEQADVGITISDMTLAESGTVLLFSNRNKGRSVSLLPKTFIAVIPKSTVVPRMTQAATAIAQLVAEGEEIASCIDFITGPSNSADIELNLIVGVHGPIKATYILVKDK